MRNFINIVEAKKKTAPLAVDGAALYDTLVDMAGVLTRTPFHLQWDYSSAKVLNLAVDERFAAHEKVAQDELAYDPDYVMTPLDRSEEYLDLFPSAWTTMARQTFDVVRSEVKIMTREYQQSRGAELDAEAGHEHDMHFIEDSDWLRAMEVQQKHAGLLISSLDPSTPQKIAGAVATISDFAQQWADTYSTDQGVEPTLTEHMRKGLEQAVPLLMIMAKRMG